MESIIIIGTGCAGLTAAIYAARANLAPLVIEGLQPGGQLTTTSEVENYPGFAQGVDGYELTQHMRQQATRFGTRFQRDEVSNLTLEADGVKGVHLADGGILRAQSVIVASGASPRFLGVPGEKTFYGGKGVTTCATCDGAFYKDQVVVVLGGGDSACEEALFLTRFCKKVVIIHRRDALKASKIMAQRVLAHEKISVFWNKKVTQILGDQKVHSIAFEDVLSGELSVFACTGVFVAIGHVPNTQPFKSLLPCDEHGYLLALSGSAVVTRVPGVFVAGDCSDHVYRQAITAAGMGCQAAMEAEKYLSNI